MNIKDIRNKDAKGLQKLLAQERNKLRDLKFSVASKQHKNYKEVGQCRKNIAQILTVFKEKQLTTQTRTATASKN